SAQGTELLSRAAVTLDNGSPVPVAIRTQADGGDAWAAYFSASLEPKVLTVDGTELRDTILYPALRPVPIEAVLSSVNSTTAHQKRQSSGRTVTAYSVTLATEGLADHFPSGATLSGVEAIIELTWKQADQTASQPVGMRVTGTMNYQD